MYEYQVILQNRTYSIPQILLINVIQDSLSIIYLKNSSYATTPNGKLSLELRLQEMKVRARTLTTNIDKRTFKSVNELC